MKKENIFISALIIFAVVFGLISFIPFKPAKMVPQTGIDKTLNPDEKNYQNFCAGCHGEQLQSFVDRKWQFGNSRKEILNIIKDGQENAGMPAYDTAFTKDELDGLTDLIMGAIEKAPEKELQERFVLDQKVKSDEIDYKVVKVIDGFESPWGMAFLPSGEMLVTDKVGKLYLIDKNKEKKEIKGVPQVQSRGQGGLMDIELHPDFKNNNILYLSFSKPKNINGEDLSTTAVLKAVYNADELKDAELIFEAQPYLPTRHHYGSRIEFDIKGHLYVSVGDRGRRDDNPQSLANHCGKIHRLNPDGSIPKDNPFVNTEGAMKSIYSYGHRNPQGVAMHPKTGKIWTHEHGPRGGDEINIIEQGKNYGWPVISYGINYNGTTFTGITEKEGMEQPLLYWVPSIAPCGMAFVTGDKYPEWKGDLLVGSLRFKYLERCKIKNNKVVHQEMLLKNIGRLRNVRMGNDGYIYVAVERPGAIYRIEPL